MKRKQELWFKITFLTKVLFKCNGQDKYMRTIGNKESTHAAYWHWGVAGAEREGEEELGAGWTTTYHRGGRRRGKCS